MRLAHAVLLFLLGCSVSYAKDESSEARRGCSLKLVSSVELPPLGIHAHADLAPLSAEIRRVRAKLMATPPRTDASSRIHESLFERLNSISESLTRVVEKRQTYNGHTKLFINAHEAIFSARLSLWDADVLVIDRDYNDWLALGESGLADLLKNLRIDFIQAGVAYDLDSQSGPELTRIQFSANIKRRLFTANAGARRLAPELLFKIINADFTRDGDSVCYRVRSFDFCGRVKGTTLFLTEQKSLRSSL